MSDLISRQAAIDMLKNRWKKTRNYEGIGDDIAEECELYLKQVPSTQPYTDEEIQRMQDIEQAQLDKAYEMGKADAMRWIPCSERLPEEDNWMGAESRQYSDYVLMSVYNADDDEAFIDYGHTVDGNWQSDTTDCLVPPYWEVIAWMPLPEPYKEDDNEG